MSVSMKELAFAYHENQTRRGEGNVPYIVHPQAVAGMLQKWGVSEDSYLTAAAWGHDLLEDTDISEAEILEAGGRDVLDLIKILTRPENVEKSSYISQIASSGNKSALLIKAADRICNTADFLCGPESTSAYSYFHDADAVFAELKGFAASEKDDICCNAVKEYENMLSHIAADRKHDAVTGCIAGGAVGDAMGSPVEFLDLKGIAEIFSEDGIRDYVEFSDGTGSITDDTQMTLFTAEGLIRSFVRGGGNAMCEPVRMMSDAYRRWLKTQDHGCGYFNDSINSGWLVNNSEMHAQRAPGTTCLTSLMQRPIRDFKAVNNSKGCGTVMRMAPAGLLLMPAEAYRCGCEFSAITHGHPTGIIAGGAFAMLISYLVNGESLINALDMVTDFLETQKNAEETAAALKKARSARSVHDVGQGWIAEEALAIGVYCSLENTYDFERGILEAVNISGDSDSAGSITGNILGVINGIKQIPEKWIKNLREINTVLRAAGDISAMAEADDKTVPCKTLHERYPGS